MDRELAEENECCPADEKLDLVLDILRGQVSADEAARSRGVPVDLVDAWVHEFLSAGATALGTSVNENLTENRAIPSTIQGALGIWVASVDAEPLAPALFMEASCSGRSPETASVAWIGVGRPPQPFRRTGAASLLWSESSCIPINSSLHLWSSNAAETRSFERESNLSDWQLPFPIAGAVMLVDRTLQEEATGRLSRILVRRSNRTFSWIQAQQLPFVVAAIGYNEGRELEESIRRRHNLAPNVPIVPGPYWALARPFKPESRGMRTDEGLGAMMSFLFGRRNLCLDSSYAEQVVRTLYRLIVPICDAD